jgi:hypothetical protein
MGKGQLDLLLNTVEGADTKSAPASDDVDRLDELEISLPFLLTIQGKKFTIYPRKVYNKSGKVIDGCDKNSKERGSPLYSFEPR